MARAKISQTTDDLITDSGAVLWSFVKGEQLEYPITLGFLSPHQSVDSFQFEAVVVEASNEEGQLDRPQTVQVGGVQSVLTIRKPVFVGQWNPAVAYNFEEVVLFDGKYYKLLSSILRVSPIEPSIDPAWEEVGLNVVYLQFPSSLASTWAIKPGVSSPVYGFFELRVTEPQNSSFVKTWKPVRGMVEILFSPTDLVPD